MAATYTNPAVPLYVDLDGTLIYTDCLYESFLRLFRLNPLFVFFAFAWLIKGGREYMKTQIAARADIDVTTLPYNQELIEWLLEEKSKGREIVLATASHHKYADLIASHLGIFDRVLATGDGVNLKGENKAQRLVEESGRGGFDYVGDSKADLKVWKEAHGAVVVARSDVLVEQAAQLTEVVHRFSSRQGLFSLKALRPHQWLKNVLIFVPLFTSHQFLDAGLFMKAFVAFIALSLCASSVYLLNDLLDLEEDRVHPRKKYRAFAAGDVGIVAGIATLIVLLLTAFLIAAWVGPGFFISLALYYFLTLSYSLYLKRLRIIDILLLASLYTIRIAAGAAAISVPLSSWLLAFSMFFFLSLSLVKRYAELHAKKASGVEGKLPGRQYHTEDNPLILWLGLASGYLAVAVLALYVGSSDVLQLYRDAELLWIGVPLVFLWVSRIWYAAYKGEIEGDPVLFVIRDHLSQIALAGLVAVVVMAAY